jgi:hypothetical protein
MRRIPNNPMSQPVPETNDHTTTKKEITSEFWKSVQRVQICYLVHSKDWIGKVLWSLLLHLVPALANTLRE